MRVTSPVATFRRQCGPPTAAMPRGPADRNAPCGATAKRESFDSHLNVGRRRHGQLEAGVKEPATNFEPVDEGDFTAAGEQEERKRPVSHLDRTRDLRIDPQDERGAPSAGRHIADERGSNA